MRRTKLAHEMSDAIVGTKPSRRAFLMRAVCLPAGLSLARLAGAVESPRTPAPEEPFALPPLPYPYGALEPHIDEQTMRLHHDRHHAAYVQNLNAAIAKAPELAGKDLDALLRDLNHVPEAVRTAVRNNGGGHYNHSMFWTIMKPGGGGEPGGTLAAAINDAFGSLQAFQEQFNDAGVKRFGSGWVWLIRNREGKLQVVSTPNQDSPLMDGQFPIMGNDVWEHAYYLKYQNRRADYLKAWWNTVNWEAVNERFTRSRAVPPG